MSGESGFDIIRTLVSGRKKRFIQEGFNLDLTYITEKIIAMAYPSDSHFHKVFRNDIDDVYSFFEKYHSSHWKIINVAMEINYSHTKLGGNVYSMGFEDHTPPPFLQLLKIIDIMDQWLTKDPLNVIAVHCKAGKGRTGTMITCYLIYLLKLNCPDIFSTSDSILSNMLTYFNDIRAKDQECVSVPSQKRYCGYYIQFLRNIVDYPILQNPIPYKLLNIEFLGTFNINLTSVSIYTKYNPLIKDLPIVIHKNYLYSNNMNTFGGYFKMEPNREVRLVGDTLFKVYAGEICVFKFVIHTSFIPNQENGYPTLTFNKDLLDGGTSGHLSDMRFKNDFKCRINLESYPVIYNNNIVNHNIVINQNLNEINNNVTSITNLDIDNNGITNSFPPPVPDRSKRSVLTFISNPTN